MNNFEFTPKSSYSPEELIACGRGELFGAGNAKLPLPPMLMFDAIDYIGTDGAAENARGRMEAHLDIRPDLWFFNCHFYQDPVMPGCLGLDAMWQMVGFFLAWNGGKGYGRALGVQEVKFSGMVMPTTVRVDYSITVKRVLSKRITLGIADGVMKADGEPIYSAKDLKVGLFVAP